MTAPQDGTKKAALDRANPNTLADHLRNLEIGSLLRAQVPVQARGLNFVANGVTRVATFLDIELPNYAKAQVHLKNYVKDAASAKYGLAYTLSTDGAPGTTEVDVLKSGNLRILASDAVTDMDITYLAVRGEAVELFLPVATGIVTLPSTYTARGVILLAEAELLAGSVLGRKDPIAEIDYNGGSPVLPATLKAALDFKHEYVFFNNATDAGTRCRLVLILNPEKDLANELDADETLI